MIRHQNNFATNLTSNTLAGATTTPLNAIPSIDAPYFIALDATNINSKYEVVYVTSDTTTNINHAATLYAHTTAEEVRLIIPAVEMDMLSTCPQGYMLNGKISVTDAAGITVAIKTLAGTDPSVTDPVWVRIGDTMRAITSALSVAKADGTNWMNAGSSELATKEIDYFVYLGYNATDGVVIGFSRIPGANQYSDFSTTTTNEKYCAISTIANAASTDYYEVIGRFAATLSAGAGYTWSVPTFTAANLIQRPIYETRVLSWLPTWAGWSDNTSTMNYHVSGTNMFIHPWGGGGTSNSATTTGTLPFLYGGISCVFQIGVVDNSAWQAAVGRLYLANGSKTIQYGKAITADNGFTASGGKTLYSQSLVLKIG